MADRGDGLVDLAAGQFAALAGLGALHDLDLQFVGVGQVVDGHAEPAAGHLLDRAARRIAVRHWRIAARILAALAGVRLAADAVHGHGQHFVGLGADGAETHGAGGEALDDLAFGFDLVDFDGPAVGAAHELQQPAKVGLGGVLPVRVVGEAPVGALVIGPRGHLQVGDGLRVPHVRVAVPAPVEVAGVRQHNDVAVAPRIAERVTALQLLGEDLQAHALHPARGAAEGALDDVVRQPHRLEDLRALVGLQRGDAHLRHHLEHALGGALAVGLDDVAAGGDVRCIVEIALLERVPQGLEGEIRIDGVGAVARQQAVVMHFPGLAGLQDDADARARVGLDQVMVHGPHREQGADRHPLLPDGAIGEHDEAVALVDGPARFGADAVQRGRQARYARTGFIGDVDGRRLPAPVIEVSDGGQFFVGQDGMRDAQPVRVLLRGLQQVPFRAAVAVQRHDDLFPDRVDGRVGHLGETLLEVVVEHARLVGHHGQRGVVAHGAERVAQFPDQRLQHDVHGLDGVAEGVHARRQRGRIARRRQRGRQFLEFDALPVEPVAVRTRGRPLALDFLVRDHAALLEVDQEDAARLQTTLPHHALGGNPHHADFRGHDAAVVVGNVVTARPQPVAVEHGADIGAVRESDRGRPVPGFHQAGLVLVEGALGRVHPAVLLPGFGNHHQYRFLQLAAGHQQELQHVVEGPGVGTVGLHDRKELGQIVAEQRRAQHALAGVHRVDVAEQRVDLAVVAHEAVGLRAVPRREGVGAEAGMHHGQVGLEIRLAQVREKRRHLVGREHALVDDDLGRQRTDVEQLPLRQALVAAQQVRRVLADQVQLALELILRQVAAGIGAHEQLNHVRHGGPGRLADVRAVGIDRQFPPAQKPLARVLDFALQKPHAAFPFLRVGGQEHDPHAVMAALGQIDAEFFGRGTAQEAVRQAEEDARPVAGVFLVADAAAMLHRAVHAERVLDNPAARAALDIADEADAATVLLQRRIVQALLRRETEAPPSGQGSVLCSHGPILKPCAAPPSLRRPPSRRGKISWWLEMRANRRFVLKRQPTSFPKSAG